jgi:hypothetical protein
VLREILRGDKRSSSESLLVEEFKGLVLSDLTRQKEQGRTQTALGNR